jgi:hypothetical protein
LRGNEERATGEIPMRRQPVDRRVIQEHSFDVRYGMGNPIGVVDNALDGMYNSVDNATAVFGSLQGQRRRVK